MHLTDCKKWYIMDDEKRRAPSNGAEQKIQFQKEYIMKSTGMVRKVDELGRIVLPAEIRQSMDINVRDALEIFTDEGRIVLQKYEPSCVFCTNVDSITLYKNKRICADCLAALKGI